MMPPWPAPTCQSCSTLPQDWAYNQWNFFFSTLNLAQNAQSTQSPMNNANTFVTTTSNIKCNDDDNNNSNDEDRDNLPQHYWHQCSNVTPVETVTNCSAICTHILLPHFELLDPSCTSTSTTKQWWQWQRWWSWSPNHSITAFKHLTISKVKYSCCTNPLIGLLHSLPVIPIYPTMPSSLSLPTWRVLYPGKLNQICPLIPSWLLPVPLPSPKHTIPISQHMPLLPFFTYIAMPPVPTPATHLPCFTHQCTPRLPVTTYPNLQSVVATNTWPAYPMFSTCCYLYYQFRPPIQYFPPSAHTSLPSDALVNWCLPFYVQLSEVWVFNIPALQQFKADNTINNFVPTELLLASWEAQWICDHFWWQKTKCLSTCHLIFYLS